MAEWSIAAVLKTVDLQGSGGSNPSLSADNAGAPFLRGIFIFREIRQRFFSLAGETGKEKQTATAGYRHCMPPPPFGFTAR